MFKLLLAALILPTSLYSASIYQNYGYWNGNNMYSSAPGPSCICDINPNVKDCPYIGFRYEGEYNVPAMDICYDEFIPEGSNGYVHAIILRIIY